MKVVYTLRHRLHHPEHEFEASRLQPPFEHPGRAEIIRASLAADDTFRFVAPDDWGTGPIEAVHHPGLVRFLETAWAEYQETHGATHDVVPDLFALGGLRDKMGASAAPLPISARLGQWCFETTTPLTQTTYEAARSAVDVALSTAAAVLAGDHVAYGLCRPPGHHAAHALYGGYCFFNNAAIVAHHLASTTGSKVSVLDVDYHHGNGTQQIFYDRDDVQFVSLHGDPARSYPYHTGFADETGAGPGRGSNVNVPLAAGTAADEYVERLEATYAAIEAAGPSMLVVSLGVDTFEEDPISDLALTTDAFERCGRSVAELGLPTVVLQEGGYADDALGENVRRWLTGFADAQPGDRPDGPLSDSCQPTSGASRLWVDMNGGAGNDGPHVGSTPSGRT